MAAPLFSVIIATRNRAAVLPGCFDALADQKFDRERFEVLVIDNGSTDDTAQVLREEAAAERIPLRVVTESRLGTSWGRNTGVSEARGEYAIFLDDDAVPERGWLAAYEAAFVADANAIVQGRIIPRFLGGRPAWLGDAFLPWFGQVEQGAAPSPSVGTLRGGNCGIARRAFLDLGGFRTDLGPGRAGLGDDTEFGHRAIAGGHAPVYWPDALVYHLISSERTRRAAFLRRCYRHGISQATYREYNEHRLRMVLSFVRTSVGRLLKAGTTFDPIARMQALSLIAEHFGRVRQIIRQKRNG